VGFLSMLRRTEMDLPRLVRLHDVTTLKEGEDQSLCMVIPKLNCSLGGAVEGKALTPSAKLQVAQDLLSGLHFMHANGFMHRDIKSDNVMLDFDMRGVLIDFSLVKHVEENAVVDQQPTQGGKKGKKAKAKAKQDAAEEKLQFTAGAGTPTYTAPEVIRGEPYDQKADCWSAGVVLLEMFQGVQLDADKDSHAFKLIEATTAKMGDKPVPTMLKKLLTVAPSDRWSCAEALRSPVFEKLSPVADPRLVQWEFKEAPVPAPTKKGKEKEASVDKEISKYCNDLDLNAATERAAKAYAPFLAGRPTVHAVILASRLYEQENFDLTEMADFGLDDFDLDAYCETEKFLLNALDYCLLLPPPKPLEGDRSKRRKLA